MEHYVVLCQDRHDHALELATLALVNRYSVGERDFIQLRPVIFNLEVEADRDLTFCRVKVDDPAEITVEDHLIVVVPELHDFVPDPVLERTQSATFPVHIILKPLVQIGCPGMTLIHRRKYLDIINRIKAIARR